MRWGNRLLLCLLNCTWTSLFIYIRFQLSTPNLHICPYFHAKRRSQLYKWACLVIHLSVEKLFCWRLLFNRKHWRWLTCRRWLTYVCDHAKNNANVFTTQFLGVGEMAEGDLMMSLPSLQHVIACSADRSCFTHVSSTLLSSHHITQVDMVCLSHTYSEAWRLQKRPALLYICHDRLRAGAYCRCNSRPSLDRLFPPPVAMSYCKRPHFCQQAQLGDQPIII